MQRCEAKINFFKKKCNITTKASCVYCGDFFCIEHGIIEDDHMYVCSKKKCVLKYEDLQQHHIWLENAYSLNAQKNLEELQGINNSWFCGSYFGYGFHEDGLKSGLNVATKL